MKLLIDLSNHTNIYAGVTVYALRILQGFRENKYSNIIVFCNPVSYEYIRKLYPEYIYVKAYVSNKKGILGNICNYFNRGKQINLTKCDVVFTPALALTVFFVRKRVVQTIHDLQGLKISKGFNVWLLYFLLSFILIRSNKIITISEFVKKEIQRVFPFISLAKIQTIYNSLTVEQSNGGEKLIPEKYILYVGTLREYKNVLTLLKAFNLIKDKIVHKFVIIGTAPDDYWEQIVEPFIKEQKLAPYLIHISHPITTHVLNCYYKFADLLVHPSLMEGFGYTPIEAAIWRIPVLTTKETALFETTMGVLNYYEPATDETILSERILDLLRNPPAQDKLKIAADLLLQQYDCCQQAKKIYQYITTKK